jgi:Na+/H+ antiporter NhaC
MDQFAVQFFTTTTLVFVTGVSVLVLFVRKMVELAWSNASTNKWWAGIILPTLPIAVAVIIALVATKYPYPAAFAVSRSARFFFGLVCGAFSDLIYMKVKKVISDFAGGDSPAPVTALKP